MSDPIIFSSTSARFELPMLFAAQAQKEIFVNEALSRIDALLHLAIEGEANLPPADPRDGAAWIIGNAPQDAWQDHPGEITFRQQGNWLFATPQEGMTVYDKSTGQFARFDDAWKRAGAVPAPVGGEIVDSEARNAIAALTNAMTTAGILAAS